MAGTLSLCSLTVWDPLQAKVALERILHVSGFLFLGKACLKERAQAARQSSPASALGQPPGPLLDFHDKHSNIDR